MSGNVAKLVNRLSKDLSQLNKTTTAVTTTTTTDINFRRPGNMMPRTATVRYSYKAAHEDELDLEVDDVIDVLEEAETGWMKGRLRHTGRVGLFPTNFVQFNSNPPDNITGNKNASKLNDVKKKVLESAGSGGDLSPEDPVPRSSVVDDSTKSHVNSQTSTPGKKGNAENAQDGVCARARILFTYSPKHEDELALREVGQVIAIVSKSTEDPGWLLAEIDGKRGLIPDNFVEILRPAAPVAPLNSTATSDTHKMPPPPNVPVKPAAKPSGLSSGPGRRATTSSVFAQMHSTLADAFTKPPKQFTAKAVRTEEGPTGEGRSGDRLSHITASRPKQPNKRPPSTVFTKRKSNESSLDDGVAVIPESGGISPTTPPSASLSNSLTVQQTLTISPSLKSTKMPPSPSPKSGDIVGGGEMVPRSEYNRLAQQFEEFRTEMNKFRLEMLQKVAALEAQIAKQQ